MRGRPRTHLVSDRLVFTYQPDGWPAGVLTGYVNQAPAFILEHVVVFPGQPQATLRTLLTLGLEEAWHRQYQYVAFFMPADHPRHRGLTTLATRLGFVEATAGWWRIWPPA